MTEPKEFKNEFDDYNEGVTIFDATANKLVEDTETPLLDNIFILLEALEKHLSNEVDWSDTSIYTGTTGFALLYLRMMDVHLIEKREDKKDFLKSALSYIEPILPYLKKKKYSFIMGVSGPLAVGSVIYHRMGRFEESQDLSKRLENLERDVCAPNSDCPDELLYGRVGYLYALMYVQKHLGKEELRDNIIQETVQTVLKSGQRLAKKFKNTYNIPLFYEWHEKPYIGAAHGFAGILYMLLQAKDYMTKEQLEELVKPCIEFVLTLQFPSGNYPSSLISSQDKFVQWCHGAPGVIHLLLLAYETFQEEKYLKASIKCSDLIWQKGLLRKGYGICHGVAGNGYAHLRLFQATKEVKYLYRAAKFAEWCFAFGTRGVRTPDRPLSLFEGFAGTLYFLVDLLDPLTSGFPAFQL